MYEVKVSLILPMGDCDRVRYMLLEPVTLLEYTAPEGFITDGASVPRLLWFWLPPVHKYFAAAVIHDWLLSINTDRKIADKVFYKCLQKLGINPIRSKLMYWGVSLYSLSK
jgi:hypothetical protein